MSSSNRRSSGSARRAAGGLVPRLRSFEEGQRHPRPLGWRQADQGRGRSPARLCQRCRLVARLSGDEFAIIQTSLNQNSDAAVLAMRVREAVHEPFDLDGNRVVVDVSIGISVAPDDARQFADLLKTADIALYEAKNHGTRHLLFL